MNGRSDVSLDLFKEMLLSNVVPDKYALSCILNVCSMLEFFEGGKQVHAYVLRSSNKMDSSVSNILIDFYAKFGEIKAARKIFDRVLVKNVVSWTMMISGYMQNGFHWEALNIYKEMNKLGWNADQFSCTSVLISCGSLEALDQGKQVHAYSVKVNLETDEYVTNSLIDMYCKCNSLGDAKSVFLAAAKLGAICYNAMMEGYTRKGSLYDALDIFNVMRHNFVPPTILTFINLLGVSASHTSVEVSRQLHSLMIKHEFCFESFGGSALIDVYSKFSYIKNARLVFEEINEKDIVCWNSMLFGYVTQYENEEALRLYIELQHGREKPNGFTLVAVIMASSYLASLSHGLQFHCQAVKIGLDFDSFVANALMDMYAKCGSTDASHILFNGILNRDTVCWNSMITMHAQHGNAEKALQMFEQMQALERDYVTFVGVLAACAHAGLVEKGFHLFESMFELGIDPGPEHYTCMVSLLGRAGEMSEAKSFIENMPIKPSGEAWKSLLSACIARENVELGRHAAEMAILHEPNNSGSYVMLSNIFVSKSMGSDVKKVRAKMENHDVVKETGYSWIEINEEVHLFVAQDRTHQQTDLIYAFVDKLIQQIKGVSYEHDYVVFASL